MDRASRERWIDIGSRVLGLGYFGLLCFTAARQAFAVAPGVFQGTATEAEVRTLLVRATAVAFSGLLVGVYLFRGRAVRKARGLLPRLTALMNAVVLPALLVLPTALRLFPGTQSTALAIAGFVLVGLGHLLAVFVLAYLGRSFSILPEARRLVTHGPYARVRHPLYLVELLALAGVAMQHWSWWAALVVTAQLGVLLARMRFEEQVLEAEFPEYAEYRARTRRLIPWVW